MKKSVFAITFLSISLFLGACSSSGSATADNSQSTGSQQEETSDNQMNLEKESGSISFDDFELTYTEKDTELGYTGVYVSITNHSDFTILFPSIEYDLKPGVTREDVQAAMPDGLKFNPYENEKKGGIRTNSANPYVKPSEASEEMVIIIHTMPYDRQDGNTVKNCPITQEILDLLEVKEVRGAPIVGGKKKNSIQLNPGDSVLAETLEDSTSLFNEVVEGGKDLIIVPDSTSFYTTYEYNNAGLHGYGFDFFDVEQAVMDKCIEDYKAKYPPALSENSEHYYSDSGMYMYYGHDSEDHELRLQWYKDLHYISGSVTENLN